MQVHITPVRQLPPDLVEAAHTHAAFALTRFSRSIRSVTIRFDDPNGPKGGVDKLCTVTIHLIRPGEDVVVTHADVDGFAALSRAIVRAARVVARRLDRRRSWRMAGERGPESSGQDDRQSP